MAGFSAYGTILRIDTNIGHGRLIAELTNISGPSISVDTIDVTTHDSPGAFREFVAGLIDAGEISFEGNLIDIAQSDELMDAIEDREAFGFEIQFPEGEQWEFDGIVTGFETSAPHDGKIGFSASVKATGEAVLI